MTTGGLEFFKGKINLRTFARGKLIIHILYIAFVYFFVNSNVNRQRKKCMKMDMTEKGKIHPEVSFLR